MHNLDLMNLRDEIAIIGMAGRFPGACDIDRFWQNLRDGVESITFFSPEEQVASGVNPEVLKDPNYVPAAGYLEEADSFDASFFGISPKEAEIIDPQHRIFLECAWSAIENAGYDPEQYDGLIGVFGGVASNTYFINNISVYRELIDSGAMYYMAMLGSEKDFPATRVSYKLNLKGPSINVQSACSTSGVAVHLACQSLLNGDSDMALAGGARVRVPLKLGHIYVEGGITSPDGHCRAFDEKARGIVYGSGVGIIVLKRLADALRDGDFIHAIIKGTAINNDGASKVGFTAPSIQGQAAVIEEALKMAEVDADTISYVEAHGTGTAVGDPIEITALTKAFRKSTDRIGFCRIGSVKTNIGHLDAGAGVAGIIKTVLALKHEQIPPSLNFEKANPQIDFDNSPFYVNNTLSEWKRGAAPRRAGVSSFGLGGTNAHIILEEAPEIVPSGPSRPKHLLLLSTKTGSSLDVATANLREYIEKHPVVNIADASYTLQTGRQAFNHRRMLVCEDARDAVKKLESQDPTFVKTHYLELINPPVVFMFPGQAAQYVNMGLNLYEHEPLFRENVDQCAEILQPLIGRDLREVLYPKDGDSKEAADLLRETRFTQPAMFTIEYALAKLWNSWGVNATAMIGHSIGEYTAACLAGVFSLEDALMLVATRGRMMQNLPGGSMISVRMPAAELESKLNHELSIAAINGPSLCVVSGNTEAVIDLRNQLEKENILCRLLHTSHAFHSPMMDSIIEPFAEHVKSVQLSPPTIPLISTVTATWFTPDQATDHTYWSKQLRATVRFSEGVKELWKEPERVLLEVGPRTTLATLARQQAKDIKKQISISSLGDSAINKAEWDAILNAVGQLWIKGVPIDWKCFYAQENRHRVYLPTYPFERKRFWIESTDHVVAETIKERPAELQYKNEDSTSELAVSLTQEGRKDRLISMIKQTLEEASGMDFTDVEDSITFLEMGFDSLFLTQWTFILKKKFDVQILFHRLFDDLSTIGLLAEYIDQKLTSEVFSTTDEESFVSLERKSPIIVQQEGMFAKTPDHSREDLQSKKTMREDASSDKPMTKIEPVSRSGNPPLSYGQQRLWYLSQLGPNTSVYNLPDAYRLTGRLDIAALEQSLNEIIKRHEVLRTTYRMDDDLPVQIISQSLEIDLPLIDISDRSETEREIELANLLEAEASQPFDLAKGPLIRTILIRLEEKEHVLFFMPHHSVFDGWSFGVFQRELIALYEAFTSGHKSPLADLPIQYADYAIWQRQWLKGEELERQMSYWMEQLGSELPVLQMPTDYPRPAIQSPRGSREVVEIPQSLVESLKELGRQEEATLFMVLLAAYKTILYRYTGQEDLCVGSPIANRIPPETKDLIGFFVNTLVLRTNLQGEPTFRELLGRVREVCIGAYSHQNMPFEVLVEKLNPERDLSRTPIYQTLFAFLTGSMNFDIKMGDVLWRREKIVTRVTQTDLSFWIAKIDNGISATLEYCTDLFDVITIKRFLEHFRVLLEGIAVNPDIRISELPLLTESELQQLASWNDTSMEYPRDDCLHHLFEAQVKRTPDAIAVEFEKRQLTYLELNQRANQLAHYLQSLGVGPEVLVGICMERSTEMLVGLLGILKAGGAYVPLDPEYPKERLAYMLDDAQVPVLLTQKALKVKLPEGEAQFVYIDSDWKMISKLPEHNPTSKTNPQNLAYVIFTSGSTGKPKGVKIRHGAVVNFLTSMSREPGLTEKDVLLSVTTLSFDIAALELFLPLTVGARTVVVSREVASDGVRLLKAMTNSAVTVMQATPATWKLLIAAGWKGSNNLKILCGGEAFPRDLVSELIKRASSVWNMYGPTETTIWSTCYQLINEDGPILIGRPIANTQVYILDSNMKQLPVGVPGELYIGGAGIARGYLNRPEETEKQFIRNPFSNIAESRLYKTGDLARFHKDGTIEWLGRTDFQVKIRGYRIELGEIETLLNSHPALTESIVLAREDVPGDKRLVAYIIPKVERASLITMLRKYLQEKLPDYMLPSTFVVLEKFPLTPSGKIDRKALPKPDIIEQETGYVAPRDQLELQLTSIWQKVLGVKPIGIKDNFFELGGHSLLAAQLFAQIEKVLGRNIPLATLFQAPTIEQIADNLRKKDWKPTWSSLVPIQTGGSKLPLFLIHGAEGNVLLYRDLAHYLGKDQPVYGLQSEGLDGKTELHTSLETMAAHYIEEIRSLQPEGPYYLGGYCLGGTIAFEMAQQLQKQGQEVKLVAMFETYNIQSKDKPPPGYMKLYYLLQDIKFHIYNIFLIKSKDKLRFLSDKTQITISRFKVRMDIAFSKIANRLSLKQVRRYHHLLVDKINDQAQLDYMPKVYPGRVTIFRPKKNFTGYNDHQFGWKGLAEKGVEVHMLPFFPKAMMVEPFVQILAAKLKTCMHDGEKTESNVSGVSVDE